MGGRRSVALLAVVVSAVLAGCGDRVPAPVVPQASDPVVIEPAPNPSAPVVTAEPVPGVTLRAPVDAFEPTAPSDGAPAWFVLAAVAFADADHGWVAGTTGGAGAFALETRDGGRTWEATQVGLYVAPAIALGADGSVWVSTDCYGDEPGPDGCIPTLQRRGADGRWRAVADVAPVEIDFAGTTGAMALVPPNARLRPDGTREPVLQVSSDGGETWGPPVNPCGTAELRGITTPRAGEVMVACGRAMARDGTPSLDNLLLRSRDAGATWDDVRAPDTGTVLPGRKVGFDIAADGTGFWWGAFTPAMATTDGGRTWTVLEVADGDQRAGSGASVGGASGYLGVGERLVWTADGTAWEDRALFPEGPCCGG